MKKYGSDPNNVTEVFNNEKLQRLEDHKRTKQSVTFGETALDSEVQDHERPRIYEGKEWTPQDGGVHNSNYADGRSHDEDI